MLNFDGLKTESGALLERSDNAILTKLGYFLNDGYRYIAGYRPWAALLRQQTFDSVADLDYFITGAEVDQVIDISQRSTPIVLALQRYYALLSKNFDAMSLAAGNPITASPMGDIGIMAALAADGKISVVSDSALDTTQKVRIQGYSANLVPITELVTLTGTSAATTTATFSSKEGFEPRFAKDGDTVGTITISAGSVTIGRIAPLEKDVRYKKWKVWPAFQSSITMYLTFKKRITALVNAEDMPELECDNALKMFAFARAMQEKRQFSKAKEAYGVRDIDGTPTPGSFLSELDALIAREPQFSENFSDQFIPQVERDPIDCPANGSGFMIWPSG